MKINNQVDTTSGGGNSLYLDSREIKTNGIKVRLYGDAEMGYSYFQQFTPNTQIDIYSLLCRKLMGHCEGVYVASSLEAKIERS